MKRCPQCRATGPETFNYMRKRYVFDVDAARKLVSDGRQPFELDADDTRFFVHTSHIHWDHVPHVDDSIPGIVAHIFFTTKEGEFVRAQLLIDGHHRAARALDEGRPFHVYVLTEDESEAILLRAPCGAKRPNTPTRRRSPTTNRKRPRARVKARRS